MSSNGKGSANRTNDNAAFAENYAAIDWGRSYLEEMPGMIQYERGELGWEPVAPKGWRFLRADEILKEGDMKGWRLLADESPKEGDSWAPVGFWIGALTEQHFPCRIIRKVEAALPLKEIFPSDDVTDIAERNPS